MKRSKVIKNDLRDKMVVEIGDFKQPDFKPQFKIMRWDNEVNFSIRAEEHPLAEVDIVGDIVKYITPSYEVHMYDKYEAGEDGGFEFEWVLLYKPRSNILTTTIQTKGLDFFYQPSLTQREVDNGLSRSENVIGSYAVYHKTKAHNGIGGKYYKTGKAFHIYRPKIIDASGSETWGELNIDEQKGTLTVTVPQDFLDTAFYPVICDPTFGYTSQGASEQFYCRGRQTAAFRVTARVGTSFTLSEEGTLDSVTALIKAAENGETYSVDHTYFINRTDSGGSGTHEQVASAETLDLSVGSSFTEKTINCASEVLTADDYIINILANPDDLSFDSSVNNLSIAVDTTGGTHYSDANTDTDGTAYSDLKTSPWVKSSSGTNKYSLYATYTLGGGGGGGRTDVSSRESVSSRTVSGSRTVASSRTSV